MSFDVNVDLSELRRVPFLSGLSNVEAEALCQAGELHEADEGVVIVRQGDPGQDVFVILDGEVAIERADGATAVRRVAVLGPGTMFGEINFLIGSARTASVRALRPTRLVFFRRESLESLDGPGRRAATALQDAIARVLALRLSRMNEEMGRARAEFENVIQDTNRELREWTAQHSVVSHLASELRELAERTGAGVGRMAEIVREADVRAQRLLHGWKL